MNRTEKEIDLIYSYVHSDYKSIRNGKKCILYLDPRTGGSASAPIEVIPEDTYNYYLSRATKQK